MPTVAEIMHGKRDAMTRAERQLASAILDNYPISGLGSITELAEAASVSTPTVARMVQKLGYSGYAEFQNALRDELEAIISNPIDKRETWVRDAPEEHILNRFAAAAIDNLRRTMDEIEAEDFEALCDVIADPDRRLHISGGRITGTLAQYLYRHLQMMRPNVFFLPSDTSIWPHHMLDIGEQDALIVFDVRRYENSTLVMAEMAYERGAEIILMTDQWRSPIHRIATQTFAARISAPSAWDSSLALMLLIECAIAAAQETLWDMVKGRTDELEATFDRTRMFRKFK